ncbi:MAG: hypothetical protein IPL42_17435 [Saprospiraceae bacterium]|nr:hypothetical protein [Saprospiraceae bacterium]
MKTTEELFDRYLDKFNELKIKGELWRLRVKPDEFLAEVEKIRAYGIEQRKSNYKNEYHIQCNQESMIEIMLMDIPTYDEMKEQFDRLAKDAEVQFALEAPAVQLRLQRIQTPLNFNDVVNIYKWLLRKQINLQMLSKEVFEEFRNTRQFELLLKKLNKL